MTRANLESPCQSILQVISHYIFWASKIIFKSYLFNSEGETRDSVTLEDPVMGLSGIESKFLDGLLSCGFIRQKNLTIPVPNHPESTLIFDLSQ